MGDIADMMINGALCEACGEFIDGDEPGYMRYCSKQCAKDRGVEYNEPNDDCKDDDGEPSIDGIYNAMDGAIIWIEIAIDDLKALKIKGYTEQLKSLIKQIEKVKKNIEKSNK